MLHRYQILPDLNLLYYRFSGVVTRAEHSQLASAASMDPAYRPNLHRLTDNSRMTETDIDLNSMLPRRDVLAGALTDEPGPTLWAYYAPTDLGFGMARMAQLLMEDIPALEVKVFEDLPAALSYLNLPDATSARLDVADDL